MTDKLKIRLDDEQTRRTWEAAERAKAEFDSWPDWKRGKDAPTRCPRCVEELVGGRCYGGAVGKCDRSLDAVSPEALRLVAKWLRSRAGRHVLGGRNGKHWAHEANEAARALEYMAREPGGER